MLASNRNLLGKQKGRWLKKKGEKNDMVAQRLHMAMVMSFPEKGFSCCSANLGIVLYLYKGGAKVWYFGER